MTRYIPVLGGKQENIKRLNYEKIIKMLKIKNRRIKELNVAALPKL